ncbi:MAG: hypothetical protein ACPGO5_00260 [Patescibacteria group bacterium]
MTNTIEDILREKFHRNKKPDKEVKLTGDHETDVEALLKNAEDNKSLRDKMTAAEQTKVDAERANNDVYANESDIAYADVGHYSSEDVISEGHDPEEQMMDVTQRGIDREHDRRFAKMQKKQEKANRPKRLSHKERDSKRLENARAALAKMPSDKVKDAQNEITSQTG